VAAEADEVRAKGEAEDDIEGSAIHRAPCEE
jgi:hypothetical protein